MNTNIKPGTYLLLVWHWRRTDKYFYHHLPNEMMTWDERQVQESFGNHELRSELVGAWRLKSWK